MDAEQDYHLDVAGFLILRGILSAAEVSACNAALDTASDDRGERELPELTGYPVVADYLQRLCGENYVLDRPLRLLQPPKAATAPLVGGNEPLDWARSYHRQNEVRLCNGLLVLFALGDVAPGDGGFTLVPASHNSYVGSPPGVIDGSDDMQLTHQPALGAGDVLLCVGTTLHGMRSWHRGPRRLLACSYAAEEARRDEAIEGEPAPAWIEELTPEQRAVMPPHSGRLPGPVLHSDGVTCRLGTSAERNHPSIYRLDDRSGIDLGAFYHWDLCGYLVLRAVMDAGWLEAANAAIDASADRIATGGNDSARGSSRLAGTPPASLRGLFELPEPHCEPFRRMIAHPAVVHCLNWMLGSGYSLAHERAICYEQGSAGLFLHGGSEPARTRNHYALQNGRTYCESVNVAWQLGAVEEGDGGFVCVPGSHKARYPVPESVVLGEDELELVRHVTAQPGDVILFMGAAQTHGAYPWRAKRMRRVALINYKSPHRA